MPIYRRVLLKLSGEALMGGLSYGVDPDATERIARELADVVAMGVQLTLVLGGGNIFRGMSSLGQRFTRESADTVGMLATVMNALVMRDALERAGVTARVISALEMPKVAESFVRDRAIRHLEAGRIILFAAGTGHPYFSTDTAAALRALEVRAEALLKGTKVEGVFSADPMTDPTATMYTRLSYLDVLDKGLKVMDATAVALCMDNGLPLHVFNGRKPGNLARLLAGEAIGTVVG